MLTITSRNTAAISRRMMNAITMRGAAARPARSAMPGQSPGPPTAGRAPAPSPTFSVRCLTYPFPLLLHPHHAVVVHAVVRVERDVGQGRRAVQQGLDVDPRQEDRLLHHRQVDLLGDAEAGRWAGGRLQLDEQV